MIAVRSVEEDGIADDLRELWREDGKLGGSVASARQEMDAAERGLAGIMDRVSDSNTVTAGRKAYQLRTPIMDYAQSSPLLLDSRLMAYTDRCMIFLRSRIGISRQSRSLLEQGELELPPAWLG